MRWGSSKWGRKWRWPIRAAQVLPEGPAAPGASLGTGPGSTTTRKEQRIWLGSQMGVYKAGRGKVDVLLEMLWKLLRNNACRRQFSESISVHEGQKGMHQEQKFCKSISFYFTTARFINWKKFEKCDSVSKWNYTLYTQTYCFFNWFFPLCNNS